MRVLFVLVALLPFTSSSCVRFGYSNASSNDADLALESASDDQVTQRDSGSVDSSTAPHSGDSGVVDSVITAPDSTSSVDTVDAGAVADATVSDTNLYTDSTSVDSASASGCPAGMAEIYGFCIDSDEASFTDGTTQSWVMAAEYCMMRGARLCSTREWSSACVYQDPEISMSNMVDDWEWTSALGDTVASAVEVGAASCDAVSSDDVVDISRAVRCCASISVYTVGMVAVDSFYIDVDQRAALSWSAAVEACMDEGKRLCLTDEWVMACEATQSIGNTAIINDMVGGWEWTGTLASSSSGTKRGQTSCSDSSSHSVTVGVYPFRCCTGPVPST